MSLPTAYTDFDTQLNGSKLYRASEGVFIDAPDTGVTQLPLTDPAMALPVGSRITLTQTTPSLTMTAVIPTYQPKKIEGGRDQVTAAVTTTGITTIVALMAGLVTFRSAYNAG